MPLVGESAPFIEQVITDSSTAQQGQLNSLLAKMDVMNGWLGNIRGDTANIVAALQSINTDTQAINVNSGQLNANFQLAFQTNGTNVLGQLQSILADFNTLITDIVTLTNRLAPAGQNIGDELKAQLVVVSDRIAPSGQSAGGMTQTGLGTVADRAAPSGSDIATVVSGRIAPSGTDLTTTLGGDINAMATGLDGRLDTMNSELVPIGTNTGNIIPAIGTTLTAATTGLGTSVGAVIGGPAGAIIGSLLPVVQLIVNSLISLQTSNALAAIANNTASLDHDLRNTGAFTILQQIESQLNTIQDKLTDHTSTLNIPETLRIQLSELGAIDTSIDDLLGQLETYFGQSPPSGIDNIQTSLLKLKAALGGVSQTGTSPLQAVALSAEEIAKQDVEMTANRGESSVVLHARTVVP
jgi:hypothetical protein